MALSIRPEVQKMSFVIGRKKTIEYLRVFHVTVCGKDISIFLQINLCFYVKESDDEVLVTVQPHMQALIQTSLLQRCSVSCAQNLVYRPRTIYLIL